MKRILIDAKWLYKGPPSGQVVVRNQIKQLKKSNKKHRITLLIDKKDPNVGVYINEGFDIIKIQTYSLFTNLFIYPLLNYKIEFDVGVFQNSCPITFKGKSYLFVHDIIFRSHPQFFTISERILFKLILISFKYCDSILTISKNEKERIIKYGYDYNKAIHVIYNGADHLAIPSEQISINIGTHKEYILYVGRLNDRKNIHNLIKSMKFVKSDISLIIVGGSDWKNTIASNYIEKIEFTGEVSEQKLKALYRGAKAFVFISFEEGFGLPPLEAMSYKIPVIVSNRSCFPEICGDAPIYVDPDDPIDVAEKIDLICSNKKLRGEMIRKGTERVKKFTWAKHTEKLLSILES